MNRQTTPKSRPQLPPEDSSHRELREWERREDIRRNYDPKFDAEMEELDRRRDALGQAAYRLDLARKQQRGW